MPRVNLVKGDNIEGVEYRDALPVNMIAIPRQILGADGYMFQWYGISSFANGAGKDRGGIWVSRSGFSGHYRVSGDSLIKISELGEIETIGPVSSGGEVRFAYSFNNLAVVSGGNLFYYNPTDGLRQITDSVVGDPIDIAWLDGYFVLTDGEDIYHSTLLSEEEFEPLDTGNAEFRPDPSKGLEVNEDDELVAFGEFTVQYFNNTGGDNFAFSSIQRKNQKLGIVSPGAKRELNGKWYCLGRRKETAPAFHIISLGSESKFSSREVDKILKGYSNSELELINIDTMEIDNTRLIQCNLPDHTLVFNETIAEVAGIDSAWSILKSGARGDTPFRGKGAIFDQNAAKWIIGDRNVSSIGYLDESKVTQYGEIAEWILYTPFLKMDGLSIDEIEIETIPGIAPDNDATVAFSMTYDGRVYGKEWWNLYGNNYDYNQRFYFRRAGYVRDWCGLKLRGASKARMCFATLNVEVG